MCRFNNWYNGLRSHLSLWDNIHKNIMSLSKGSAPTVNHSSCSNSMFCSQHIKGSRLNSVHTDKLLWSRREHIPISFNSLCLPFHLFVCIDVQHVEICTCFKGVVQMKCTSFLLYRRTKSPLKANCLKWKIFQLLCLPWCWLADFITLLPSQRPETCFPILPCADQWVENRVGFVKNMMSLCSANSTRHYYRSPNNTALVFLKEQEVVKTFPSVSWLLF